MYHWWKGAVLGIGVGAVVSGALAVEVPDQLKRLRYVGVLSRIGVVQDMDTRKTYLIRQGEAVPLLRDSVVERLGSGVISIRIKGGVFELRSEGRSLSEPTASSEPSESVATEELDEDSLEYYRQILRAEQQQNPQKWEKKPRPEQPQDVIVCRAGEDHCPLTQEGEQEE